MKRVLVIVAAVALSLGVSAAQEKKMGAEMKPADHGVFAPANIQWKEGPPSLPAGAKLAVLEGDPSQEGLFTLRLSLPAGYRIPPHWHPAFEHVTVISGTGLIGMGEKFDESKMETLSPGAFFYMAPGMRHYAMAKTECVVQVHAMGPWQLYYVNPSDDPRQMKK